MTSVVERLRELAERLPAGGALVLTREGLLDLAALVGSPVDPPTARDELTVSELAARFHRAASTVRGWCNHGRFEGAYKLNGRDWRIPQPAVDAFLTGQRREARTTRLGAWRAVRRRLLTG